jgi:phosphoserine phosphatase
MLKSSKTANLFKRIEDLEKIIKQRGEKGRREKIAVFDLDNTLLTGDIGDAVFAQLLLDKTPMPFSWQEYQGLISANKKREAYERVVTAMAGISVDILTETTGRVMSCGASFLNVAGADVPVPAPHPVMQELLILLKSLDYDIYVISATNQYSVRFVAREYFNLPESHAFGIKPAVQEIQDPVKGNVIVLGDTLTPPVTIAGGKADLYKKYISATPPLIAAGDSETDIPMLNLTGSSGLVIWVGTDEKRYESIKERIEYPGNLFFFQR